MTTRDTLTFEATGDAGDEVGPNPCNPGRGAPRSPDPDTGTYQYCDPSPAEQAHLKRINRVRIDPQAEADRLLGGDLNEGISDPAEQISLTPKQSLTSNALLHAAAGAHSRDMIDQDYFDHLSLDGRTPGTGWRRPGIRVFRLVPKMSPWRSPPTPR